MDSSTPSDVPSDSAPLILAPQRPIFERLLAIGRACFSIQRHTLPVRPRTNTLVVGPTGSGKTFLAKAVAAELEAAAELKVGFLSIAVSNWILLGCSERGAETTWNMIFNFLYRHRNSSGVIIFLDEIDALAGPKTGRSAWQGHLVVEVLGALDLTLPAGLKDHDGEPIDEDRYAIVQNMLANKTYIIAAGAFQNLWETRSISHIGFGNPSPQAVPPMPDELATVIPREIVNRMRGELLVLPPLTKEDYIGMLQATAAQVPAYLRETFLQLGFEKISKALAMRQGCRFLEDLLLDAILFERANLQLIAPSGPSAQTDGGCRRAPPGH